MGYLQKHSLTLQQSHVLTQVKAPATKHTPCSAYTYTAQPCPLLFQTRMSKPTRFATQEPIFPRRKIPFAEPRQ